MNRPSKALSGLAFGLLTLFATPLQAQTTAVVNVNVIPMTDESVIAAQTVVVIDGVISEIGDVDRVAVPQGATVVDGTDRFLLPGLTEMHAHVTSTAPAELRRLFSLFLANGVTTIRGMLGRPAHLELREQLADGRVLGPRLVTSGPSLNGNSVRGALDGARQVREQFDAGYDFVKIHPGLDAEEFNAIADTANELGMPFAGHVPASVGLVGALEKGIATIDHLDGYMAALLPANVDPSGGFGGFFDVMLADQVDESRIADVVAKTLDAGVANVPTETLFEQLVSDESADALGSRPESRYVAATTVEQWQRAKREAQAERGFDVAVARRAIEIRRRLIRELHDAGALLLLGSDAPQVFNVPGFSLHRELMLMVAAGLTPFEALYTGTVLPAEFLGIDGGTVEVGKLGDLMLLDANPLEDIANSRRVHGVVVGGRWARSTELLNGLGRSD